MARRQQRRPTHRPARGQSPDRSGEQAAIDAGARRLVGQHDEGSLASLVNDLRLLRDEADRLAVEQPSPQALAAYRRAERELAEAERALQLIDRAA